jgi:DNA-binding response OmpR family regulator
MDSDVDAGRAAGADHYLVKPFSPLELLRIVAP